MEGKVQQKTDGKRGRETFQVSDENNTKRVSFLRIVALKEPFTGKATVTSVILISFQPSMH